MAESGVRAEDAALWRRWRALAPEAATGAGPAPDPLLLAAYAEGRLGEAEAAAVEHWLAAAPGALADLAAARAADEAASDAVAETMIARAQALVPDAGPTVVPLRPRSQPQLGRWRAAMAWGGIAASILATSLVGFALGNDTYASLTSATTADSPYGDLLDTPSGVFVTFAEDSST